MAKKRAARESKAIDELSGQPANGGAGWIAWEAPAFAYYEKNWLWITGVVVAALVFLVLFYLDENYSAMVVVVLGAVVFIQHAQTKPEQMKYAVDEEGFHVGERRYTWSELKSFWISERPGFHHLYLETTARWLPVRTIHLANVEPGEVRLRLAQHLPERRTGGAEWTDRLIHWLRF
ncbi:hypothetical protein HY374_03070 [Candidatus Berkelbacteria bacterium]|nr:hypothetical protein [Candidatus Berkelbacteria bacterium]